MALKQVGARTEGDVYQGLFFWRQAASLLIEASLVRQVILEHDEASGVDDVVVFYEKPGINAGGWLVTADFYQVKYHVDRRDVYSSDALIDPAFINAKSSLLERFYEAYKNIVISHKAFRLQLASNWRWKSDDPLADYLREDDGKLPDSFFTASCQSHLGNVRELWRDHLALAKDEFETFARTLRFDLDHFGRRDFRASVHDRLAAAGLRVPAADRRASSYESLIQQFLMDGTNTFDSATLRDICKREGLLSDQISASQKYGTIGVRSYLRFAERLEEETEEFICAAEHFDARNPRDALSWCRAAQKIITFFRDPDRRSRLRLKEHAILLECHGSLAVLSGYELSRNSGCLSYPMQKPGRELWKPEAPINMKGLATWSQKVFIRDKDGPDIAVAVSVTHDIAQDVEDYLNQRATDSMHLLLDMRPTTGIGPASVQGPGHAMKLAAEFVESIRKARPKPTAAVHLFVSAPNSLLFFVGQFREALGRIVLYEYDFGYDRHGTYESSITLPFNLMKES